MKVRFPPTPEIQAEALPGLGGPTQSVGEVHKAAEKDPGDSLVWHPDHCCCDRVMGGARSLLTKTEQQGEPLAGF